MLYTSSAELKGYIKEEKMKHGVDEDLENKNGMKNKILKELAYRRLIDPQTSKKKKMKVNFY